MKTKVVLSIFAVVLELLLAFLPNIPGLKKLAPQNPGPDEQLAFIITMNGLGFAVLTAYLGVMTLLREKDSKELSNELTSKLPECRVATIRDDQFYDDFLAAVKRAQDTVNICYFAPYPPTDIGSPERKKYYREILSVMKSNTRVRFRRLVRCTSAMKPWLKKHLLELEGSPNVDVAAIDEGDTETPFALSVQIVDRNRVWCVALDAHERQGHYRDLYIEHASVADAFLRYFNRLWGRSTGLMDSGRLSDAGRAIADSADSTEGTGE